MQNDRPGMRSMSRFRFMPEASMSLVISAVIFSSAILRYVAVLSGLSFMMSCCFMGVPIE